MVLIVGFAAAAAAADAVATVVAIVVVSTSHRINTSFQKGNATVRARHVGWIGVGEKSAQAVFFVVDAGAKKAPGHRGKQ